MTNLHHTHTPKSEHKHSRHLSTLEDVSATNHWHNLEQTQ
uniref:Uncharacterized protein n=1 Tax=Nitrosopumivirus cobalaminus TaxID=3158414 RepID=A0AAU7N497_9VIRU